MQAAVFDGNHVLKLVDIDKPIIEPGNALVKMKYVGICGSDLFIISGKNPRTPPPLILGHECVGEIVDLDDDKDSNYKIGDTVTVYISYFCGHCYYCRAGAFHFCKMLQIFGCQTNGAFAEYVSVPKKNLIILPKEIQTLNAVLTEPTSIAAHAVSIANIKQEDAVLVVGGGPIGYLVASIVKLHGCDSVLVAEVNPYRLQFLQGEGFNTVNAAKDNIGEKILDMTNGGGSNFIFECAGQNSSLHYLTEYGAPGARMIIVANYKTTSTIDLFGISRFEKSIQTSWLSTFRDYYNAIEMLKKNKINSNNIISRVFPLHSINEGIAIAEKAQATMKIIVELG